jgi:hypothetical protein
MKNHREYQGCECPTALVQKESGIILSIKYSTTPMV